MTIITDINNCTATPCVATIGSFDGVHLGHKALLDELREKAAEQNLPMAVITFASHPRLLFKKECTPFLLSSNSEKATLLEKAGVDYLIQLDFDHAMASMSAKEFMQEIIAKKLAVKTLAIGYDHHFGNPKNNDGIDDYISYGKELGIEVFQAAQFSIEEEKVCSSTARQALTDGNISHARKILGYDYTINGTVVSGAGIGRQIGFPTANIEPDEPMKLLPQYGVYEVEITLCGKTYEGVMNIGVKPTIAKGLERTIEVYILDFSGDIYGEKAEIKVTRRLREEINFDNINALKFQIEVDVARVRRKI